MLAQFTDADLTDVVENMNFAALEKFYLPTSLPEGFQIFDIAITEKAVSIRYMPQVDFYSEETLWDALNLQRGFEFTFTRLDFDSPMETVYRQNNASSKDLIDGKYLFVEPNKIIWTSNGEILSLYTPYTPLSYPGMIVTKNGVVQLPGHGQDEVVEQHKFTGINMVNLLDANEVNASIGKNVDRE